LNQKSVGKTQECFRIKRLFVIFSLKNTLQVSLQNKIQGSLKEESMHSLSMPSLKLPLHLLKEQLNES